MTAFQHIDNHQAPRRAAASQQAYIIEIGETQAGLVSRRGDERYFTFIAASSVFNAIEGHRFATPGAAELAARQLASPRRSHGGRTRQ
ncbi:MAG: hypothetical protein DCF30_16675 [Hyphomicrobiales bacterium]|nr:MAG: hypothetical protein DCF30_16675 [Hyphomicrobiales bacterium]